MTLPAVCARRRCLARRRGERDLGAARAAVEGDAEARTPAAMTVHLAE